MNEIKPEHREAARSTMETMPLGLETVVAQLVADTEARVRAEEREATAWKLAQVLCDYCGEEGYNLVYHHDEWRHYRQQDMYVEYCKAEVVFQLCPEAAAKQQEQEP